MIFGNQLSVWIPLTLIILPVIATVIRCSILLVGLLVTLSKATQTDRPYIFREFARAMTSSQWHRDAGVTQN